MGRLHDQQLNMDLRFHLPSDSASEIKDQADGVDVVLVVPRSAFPITDLPLVLPTWDKLFRQPHRQVCHSQLSSLSLHAWRLFPNICRCRAFLSRLLKLSPLTIELQLQASTSLSSSSSRIGATDSRLTFSTSLFPW